MTAGRVLVDLQMKYAEYGYTNAVSSVMCRVRPTHSCTLYTTSVQCSKTDLGGKQNGHPQGVLFGRGIRLGRRFFALPLTSELGLTVVRSRSRENNTQLFSNTLASLRYALCGSNATPATASHGENPLPLSQKERFNPTRMG